MGRWGRPGNTGVPRPLRPASALRAPLTQAHTQPARAPLGPALLLLVAPAWTPGRVPSSCRPDSSPPRSPHHPAPGTRQDQLPSCRPREAGGRCESPFTPLRMPRSSAGKVFGGRLLQT